ncbi:MAG: metallopeptidase TldD-related protein [Gammaproteobacteria bacterium]|nr:metallopeptidase TldD-related protein [Gammaproteobacteria bacterium]
MKNTTLRTRCGAFVLGLLTILTTHADEDALMQALRAELERSLDELQMEDMEKPYFVAYTVHDTERLGAAASFGALLPSSESRSRRLSVEVRVGDPLFDNTNFRSMGSFSPGFGGGRAIPLKDNVVEIRRQVWLATDAAYKQALQQLANKRATLQNETRTEELADLAPQEPFTHTEEASRTLPDLDDLQDLARDLSALFRDMPHIADSQVSTAATYQRTYYVNSGGSSFIRNDPSASLIVRAQAQAADGTILHDFVVENGRTWDEIGNPDDLASEVKDMGKAIGERMGAPKLPDRYIGPVLFEGQAAAELFAQVLAPRLIGIRMPDTESRFASMMGQAGNPFLDKLGARVLPRFLSVTDDPTLTGEGFVGGYAVDDEGVPASPTTLVENGILKTLLTSRNPVRDIERSTGNRRGGGPAPSNLVVTARRGMTRDELVDELKLLMEEREAEFGIVVRRLGNPLFKPSNGSGMSITFGGPQQQQSSVEPALLAYKVFPDGREELLRTAEFAGIADAVFKEIVAVSDSATNYTSLYTPMSFGGLATIISFGGAGFASSFGQAVTVSVPDLLFEEISVRNPTGNVPHLPVAGHPFFEE